MQTQTLSLWQLHDCNWHWSQHSVLVLQPQDERIKKQEKTNIILFIKILWLKASTKLYTDQTKNLYDHSLKDQHAQQMWPLWTEKIVNPE